MRGGMNMSTANARCTPAACRLAEQRVAHPQLSDTGDMRSIGDADMAVNSPGRSGVPTVVAPLYTGAVVQAWSLIMLVMRSAISTAA